MSVHLSTSSRETESKKRAVLCATSPVLGRGKAKVVNGPVRRTHDEVLDMPETKKLQHVGGKQVHT
jgi:hypothetical protein